MQKNLNWTTLTEFSKPKESSNGFFKDILPFFPSPLKELLIKLTENDLNELEEIRLRVNQPLVCKIGNKSLWLSVNGKRVHPFTDEPFMVEIDLLERILALISNNSFYALEREFSQGFLTLPGGHRVGFSGEAVVEQEDIKTLKNLTALNFRIGREILGAADQIIPFLIDGKRERIFHTLIISPPGAGKTTVLRDLIRQFSDGIPGLFKGVNIGLVDERSELAGCYKGIPQKNVGHQTDILDGCPKAVGMMLLLRSMSPKIIAVDELGRKEDVAAVLEAINSGVSVIGTAHGHEIEELKKRPIMKELINMQIFERYVLLSRRKGPSTLEKVLDQEGYQLNSSLSWEVT